ncbi:DALR anticodon-binding domain-containing protein [Brevibacterium zhoupengii]|uniref:DALR anticodon-binding domain-containing protein n=1 Tax=Brevibacterium zhoupengii TaxID=2898795 RepID=UPI001F099BF1
MIPELLQTALARALASIASARGVASDRIPDPTLRLSQPLRHGHWVSPIALRSAAVLNTGSRTLAGEIAARLHDDLSIAEVEVAGPGFLNITVSPGALATGVAEIVAADGRFGPDHSVAASIDAVINQRISSRRVPRPGQQTMGTDILRYVAARENSPSAHFHEAGLWRRAHPDNPVHYVQVTHATACRVRRRAVAAGIDATAFDPTALSDDTETALAAALMDFVATAVRAASTGEPQRIALLLEAISQLFRDWTQACPVTPSLDEDITRLHASRLVLDRAAIIVLATGLSLLGVSAPERM